MSAESTILLHPTETLSSPSILSWALGHRVSCQGCLAGPLPFRPDRSEQEFCPLPAACVLPVRTQARRRLYLPPVRAMTGCHFPRSAFPNVLPFVLGCFYELFFWPLPLAPDKVFVWSSSA